MERFQARAGEEARVAIRRTRNAGAREGGPLWELFMTGRCRVSDVRIGFNDLIYGPSLHFAGTTNALFASLLIEGMTSTHRQDAFVQHRSFESRLGGGVEEGVSVGGAE